MSDEKCSRCGGDKHRGRCKKPTTLADVVEKRARKPKPPAEPERLVIEPTFGCSFGWEDGYIAVEQEQRTDDGEAITARVLLTRSDLERIAEWARP